MAMKQTQTKMFEFSDVGLDFCAGSKNLFPDRFKKMLALGYNEQTVSSVSVSGNQVTLNYGVSHGYVADRVLKIKTGALAEINGGEFWIDLVTTNTVTLTIDNAPLLIDGNFKTSVASLGWELVYELNHIHIYKFKHIDDTDMYLRLCFQSVITQRNALIAAIGKTADLATGVLTDINTLGDSGTCTTVASSEANFRWEIGGRASSAHNNYTYSQGADIYGKSIIVGSIYHFLYMGHYDNNASYACDYGVIPKYTHLKAETLDYPVLLGANFTSAASLTSSINYNYMSGARAYIGGHRITFSGGNTSSYALATPPIAYESFYPNSIEPYQITCASPIMLFEAVSKQQIGGLIGGMYALNYASTNQPETSNQLHPAVVPEIDTDVLVYRHALGGSSTHLFISVPIEEIKLV